MADESLSSPVAMDSASEFCSPVDSLPPTYLLFLVTVSFTVRKPGEASAGAQFSFVFGLIFQSIGLHMLRLNLPS